MGAPRQPRHLIVERHAAGELFFDVTRASWEDPFPVVVLRSFLSHADASRWIEDVECRQHDLVRAVDGFDARTVPFRGVE